jgi:uncharacterized membrane protein HdeD (DUF308 family)
MPSRTSSDMLFKGVVIALIGALILLGPYVARSPSVVELLSQARLVGWFALVLGAALAGRALWVRRSR